MACKDCQWAQVFRQPYLVFQVWRTKTSALHIKELGSVEDCLLLFACHLMEQIGVVRMLNEVNPAIRVFILSHVCKSAGLSLFWTHPGGERITHEENWEVLFLLKVLVFSVCHGNYEGWFVNFISNCNLGITGQVKSIYLVEEID